MARKARMRGEPLRNDDYADEDDFDDFDDDEECEDTPDSISGTRGKSLKALLAPEKLREYAWNRSFERGKEYYRTGAVASLIQHGERVNAVVQGSRKYKANIWRDDGRAPVRRVDFANTLSLRHWLGTRARLRCWAIPTACPPRAGNSQTPAERARR